MKRKLNYRFHNPNTVESTADFLCQLLMEANTSKVERALQEVALGEASNNYIVESENEVSIKRRKAR